MLLLQIPNRKLYMIYRITSFSMTMSYLQCHLFISSFFDFCTAVQSLSTGAYPQSVYYSWCLVRHLFFCIYSPNFDCSSTHLKTLYVRHIFSWMTTNLSILNSSKSGFLLIGWCNQQLAKLNKSLFITIHSIWNLGFFFVENVTFSDQISLRLRLETYRSLPNDRSSRCPSSSVHNPGVALHWGAHVITLSSKLGALYTPSRFQWAYLSELSKPINSTLETQHWM